MLCAVTSLSSVQDGGAVLCAVTSPSSVQEGSALLCAVTSPSSVQDGGAVLCAVTSTSKEEKRLNPNIYSSTVNQYSEYFASYLK